MLKSKMKRSVQKPTLRKNKLMMNKHNSLIVLVNGDVTQLFDGVVVHAVNGCTFAIGEYVRDFDGDEFEEFFGDVTLSNTVF